MLSCLCWHNGKEESTSPWQHGANHPLMPTSISQGGIPGGVKGRSPLDVFLSKLETKHFLTWSSCYRENPICLSLSLTEVLVFLSLLRPLHALSQILQIEKALPTGRIRGGTWKSVMGCFNLFNPFRLKMGTTFAGGSRDPLLPFGARVGITGSASVWNVRLTVVCPAL